MMWSWCLIPRSSGNCPGNRRLSCAAFCQSIESGGCSRLPLPYRGQFPGLWDMDAVDLPFCGEGFTCQQALFCSSCFWRMVHSTMGLWPNVVLVCLFVPVIKKKKKTLMKATWEIKCSLWLIGQGTPCHGREVRAAGTIGVVALNVGLTTDVAPSMEPWQTFEAGHVTSTAKKQKARNACSC